MLIEAKKLIGFPVYTKSGQLLGKVNEIEVETDGQLVANYQVGSQSVIRNLLSKKLIISREQIVSITGKKIVVDDNVAEAETRLARAEKESEPEISEGVAAAVRKN